MFSFVKELDDESAKLLKSISQRQNGWRRSPGVVVWAFWIGDDQEKAKTWAGQHGIDNIIFAAVSPNDPKLADWNIPSTATNTHVLACRAKRAMVTFTDLKSEDVDKLQVQLSKLVKPRRD